MEMKCEVCHEQQFKYKCPCCLKKTCSLPCSKQHKIENACNGARDKVAFVAVKEFKDLNLLSDYRFLEEAGRKADNASRDGLNKRRNKLPKGVHKLVQQCRDRGITLKTLPYPMSRRKNNKTRFMHGSIFWHVEWIFPEVNVKYNDQVGEATLLRAALEKHIHPSLSEPVIRHSLKVYVRPGVEKCRLFMKVEGRPADSVRYYELDQGKTLGENLKGKTLIEHPTIHVALHYCCRAYTLLEGTGPVKPRDSIVISSGSSADSSSSSDSTSSSTESDSDTDKKETFQADKGAIPVSQEESGSDANLDKSGVPNACDKADGNVNMDKNESVVTVPKEIPDGITVEDTTAKDSGEVKNDQVQETSTETENKVTDMMKKIRSLHKNVSMDITE